nr:reverse transcriptase [Tanacetum cinerariifolium]
MVTRSQSGIVKPIDRLSLHTTSISPLPKSPFLALQNPHWNSAMHDEYNALVKNRFVDPRYPHHVCLLQKSLYGLKQAPRAWFQQFAGYATRVGFYHSRCDSSLFILRQGSQYAIELLVRAHMTNYNPSRTLVDTDSKLGPEVQQICLYMYDPREPHLDEDFSSSLSVRLPSARTAGAY